MSDLANTGGYIINPGCQLSNRIKPHTPCSRSLSQYPYTHKHTHIHLDTLVISSSRLIYAKIKK